MERGLKGLLKMDYRGRESSRIIPVEVVEELGFFGNLNGVQLIEYQEN
jgi:hypothetical protein